MSSMFFQIFSKFKLSYWSELEFWILTSFLVLGWSPWPQGHRMLKIFQIGPQGPDLWILKFWFFFKKYLLLFCSRVSISLRYNSPKLILHIPVNLLLSISWYLKSCLGFLKSVITGPVIGMLHISTSKMVLHHLFAGQHNLLSFFK